MPKHLFSGLYAITPDTQDHAWLCTALEAALQGGVSMVQYRNKTASSAQRLEQSYDVLQRCRRAGVPLIINDDVALCAELGADGVHLGEEDTHCQVARQILGAQAIIGVSCYHSLEYAQRAQVAQANYLAFGRCFASRSKPGSAMRGFELLTQARMLGLPVVAIGGITLNNAQQLLDAGADMLAVIDGLFGCTDIQATARRFVQLFATPMESKAL